MFCSKSFGRMFWVDDNTDFRSCPQFDNGTGDFDNADYVSEWTDWEGVDINNLFNIHSFCLNNLWNHSNSLTMKDGV
tara:strand:+ start:792 stop:1022 length:231 start_codon:yes stop_codon:yes gene_type:complete